jgi:hypothetical protein
MLCARFSDIGISLELEGCRASFEASLREAPQDEAFLTPSTAFLMMRSDLAQPGRVSKHPGHSMQPIIRVGCRGRPTAAFMELSP